MSYISQEDGSTVLARGEHYHYTGYVTVRVHVSFDADDPSDLNSNYDDRLEDAIAASINEYYELESDDDLDVEIERDDE